MYPYVCGCTRVLSVSVFMIFVRVCSSLCVQKPGVNVEFRHWRSGCCWGTVVCRTDGCPSSSTDHPSRHACRPVPSVHNVSQIQCLFCLSCIDIEVDFSFYFLCYSVLILLLNSFIHVSDACVIYSINEYFCVLVSF